MYVIGQRQKRAGWRLAVDAIQIIFPLADGNIGRVRGSADGRKRTKKR